MTGRSSLDAAYFEGIFEKDDDPWHLASSAYEAAKFAHTHDVLADRRYRCALEVGCAHGVLTSRLAGLCDRLLCLDLSATALALARERIGHRPGVAFANMVFPGQAPDGPFDLVILSEVVYYWGVVDLDRAAEWLRRSVAPGGRVILVHYTGETDYPHSGDDAVKTLFGDLGDAFDSALAERRERYRLDLWTRR